MSSKEKIIEAITLTGDTDVSEPMLIEEVTLGDDDGIPHAVMQHVAKARRDIDIIHWSDAYYETATDEWVIPVEAVFGEAEDVAPAESGWHYGNMMLELDEAGNALDYSVGDWTPGMHPDMHTFER